MRTSRSRPLPHWSTCRYAKRSRNSLPRRRERGAHRGLQHAGRTISTGGERMSGKKAILVVGAGDATGGAIARRFARKGYIACVTRRHADKLAPLVARIEAEGGSAHAFGSDARKEDEVIALFAHIEKEIAPVEVAVFNIGANVRFPITETTARVYYKVWEMGCFGGFLVGREAARAMLPRARGSIFFTGASASLRGRAAACRHRRRPLSCAGERPRGEGATQEEYRRRGRARGEVKKCTGDRTGSSSWPGR